MPRNTTTSVGPVRKKPEPVLTLGEFIAGVYDACDEQRARVIVWLAAKGQLVVFRRNKGLMASK